MSDDSMGDQAPAYTFLGNSPADELLEIARLHHVYSKRLFDRAQTAQDENRQEEAKLLMDLAIAQRERAKEFERAARGERDDPIVAEILDWQQDQLDHSSPRYTPTFISKEDQLIVKLPEHMKVPPPGRIARAMAWIAHLFQP
jgi:hypothetical protein